MSLRNLFESKKVGDIVDFKIANHEWSGIVKEIKGKNIIVKLSSDLRGDWKSVGPKNSDADNVIIYKNDITN